MLDEFERERLWGKLDEFDKRLDTTCESITKIEEYIKTEQIHQKEKIEKTEKNIKWGFGILGALVSIITILQVFDVVP